MKHQVFVFLIAILFAILFKPALSQNRQFTLTGKIIGQQKGYISLTYLNAERGKKYVVDSCSLSNGNFIFKGGIKEPTLVVLRGDVKSSVDSDPNSCSLWIEPGHMNAILKYNHFKDIKVTGSKTQNDFELLHKEYKQVSSFSRDSIIDYHFIVTHPASYVSAFALFIDARDWSIDTVIRLYHTLISPVQNSYFGKQLGNRLEGIEKNSSGKLAKGFITKDINDHTISLKDFRGKCVLLDFWASWCVPCREGNPHLIDLFKRYHNEGLEIIGISVDKNHEAWKEAVAKDKINIWHNVLSDVKMSEGKQNNSLSISKEYKIYAFPTKILINKEGMIIGRYKGTESEDAMDKELAKLFNKG